MLIKYTQHRAIPIEQTADIKVEERKKSFFSNHYLRASVIMMADKSQYISSIYQGAQNISGTRTYKTNESQGFFLDCLTVGSKRK